MARQYSEVILGNIEESIQVKNAILNDQHIQLQMEQLVEDIVATYRSGGKVLFCGNGGSAADAQHLAAELSGRYFINRAPLYAEALHVNTSYLTAVANDFNFETIYERAVEGMARAGDVLILMSTSGNSENIIRAARKAKEQGVVIWGMSGKGGGQLFELLDQCICIPSSNTPRIQEGHMLIGHTVCELVESIMFC